jgi:hypothetical protein
MQKIITVGNRAVVINSYGGGGYFANLYVNARDGFQNADITRVRWSGKSLKRAEQWAMKQLAEEDEAEQARQSEIDNPVYDSDGELIVGDFGRDEDDL